MKKVVIYVLAALLLLQSAVSLDRLAQSKFPNFKGEAHIYVRPTTTPSDVIRQISSQTEIINERNLKRVFEEKQVSRYLTVGHYTVDSKTSNVQLARMLNNGWQTPVNFTLSGSLRSYGEIAAKISSQLLVKESDMYEAITDSKTLSQLGFNKKNAFALFIPDTYQVYWDATPKEILAKLKKGYDDFWTADRLKQAEQLHLDRMQVSILASIVRAESNYEPEYPKIAGVYINRYNSHMKLQADPTVAFVYDYRIDRVLKKHLTVDSPYNTYKNYGLPPGPINAPTKEALNAVLNADIKSGNIYFCASPSFDGTHKFATNYREHSKNAAAFRRALDKR